MKDYLKYLLQLILSPANGWEDIEKGDVPPSRLTVDGYLPLIALTAVSVFTKALFLHHVEFITLFLDMVITFVVYFISYFFGTFILSIFLEPMVDGDYDDQRSQTFTLYTLGLTAIIGIIFNCFPLPGIMLFFFALYIVLIQFRGIRYMHIRQESTGLFMILAVLGVLCPPYIFHFIFSILF